MASRSPSRRSTPISHTRDSSHRSPSFVMRGSTRRGRSPPVEPRRRKVMPRSGGPRSTEGTIRGPRGAEFRSSQRSIPPGGYPPTHFSPGPSQPGGHSPRRASVSKRRSFTPPLSSMSKSGKRKLRQRMRSSSSSSSSRNSPPRLPLQLPPLKIKKISVDRMPPSRETVMIPVRKQSRSKSPLTERGHMSRGANRFGARASGDELKKELKGSSYAAGRPLPKVTGPFSDPPRQVDNPQKRFVAEPVRRYSGEEDDSRPIYRGPEGKGPSFDQHELKKITVGIHRSIPANELQINRQIFNPEDVVVVRRPGASRLESISPTPMVIEKPRTYYESSPPPRMGAGYSSTSRHAWDYEQAGPSHSHSRNTSHTRHKEGRRNEDLRYELDNRRRDDASYERGSQDFRGDSDDASSDLRMRINEKRTTEHPRMTHYPDDVDEPIGVHSKGERRYAAGHHPMEAMHEQRRRGMDTSGNRSGAHLQHEVDEPDEYNPRSSIQTKSSSSTVVSWDGNPEYVPKGRAYYEHDNRDEWVRMSTGPRGGGGARGFYVRGNSRGRYFRGGYVPRGRGRGRARGRGQNMGYISRGYARGGVAIRRQGTGPSGMGSSLSTRGKPSSPSLWKHDMFENLSSDENKPTSTSESKR